MIGEERDQQRGFTLVELMMALVIFSVAVAGILSVAEMERIEKLIEWRRWAKLAH